MAITENRQGTVVEYSISDQLDAVSSAVLDAKTAALPRQFNKIIFNFRDLNYISSMGLRSVLKAYKLTVARKGSVTLKNVPPQIRQVFAISGFIETIVRDEKLAIIQKSCDSVLANFALVGGLEKTKATELKTKWDILQGDGLKELKLDCKKLASVDLEAGKILSGIQDEIIKNQGAFEMENVSDPVKINLRDAGLEKLLKGDKITEAKKAESRNIFLKYTTYDEQSIAPFEKDWLKQHIGVKRVVMDFKEAEVPPDGKAKLYKLEKLFASNGVEIELSF